ncbi:Hypothetical_protein [Hexamita inflata]|uniref:Hypothetical_protein n=1 Tax=Hexamita inflata TaxID=28002 RepID=A0AA86QC26_9EUKA|nr:Hypothetical protein HINF_LOCUS37929 [Hexamita inflata]
MKYQHNHELTTQYFEIQLIQLCSDFGTNYFELREDSFHCSTQLEYEIAYFQRSYTNSYKISSASIESDSDVQIQKINNISFPLLIINSQNVTESQYQNTRLC